MCKGKATALEGCVLDCSACPAQALRGRASTVKKTDTGLQST